MRIGLAELLRVPHLFAINLDAVRVFRGVSTDTRTIRPGEIFFAIRGERFDGHAFVDAAIAKGAGCIVIDHRADRRRWASARLLVVKDAAKAFGALASLWRAQFDIPVIAVAGSNGKTTTKEMIAAVLRTRYTVLSTKGNLNNHIGVPQTMFRLTRRHEVAVVEVGTNHRGEIAYLCDILKPTHGMITNIGREHLEFFGDIEGVATAEGELFAALGARGVGFVNADDPRVVRQARRLKRAVSYGFTKRARSLRGTFRSMSPEGCAAFSVQSGRRRPFTVELSVPGRHAMANALAAVAVGMTLNVPTSGIRRSLNAFSAVGKRMEVLKAGGVTILNDTYNANPDSVIMALETLAAIETEGKKVVILADMLELGTRAREEHRRVGEAVVGFEALLTFGELAKEINASAQAPLKKHFKAKNLLAASAAKLLAPGDIVLVKGSRGMKMEDVVTVILDTLGKHAA
jgi:UDP-N-acetylmuramoyl-tripeptide--D-alanyl-D-alanine ligase